jgi:hypothetical protein
MTTLLDYARAVADLLHAAREAERVAAELLTDETTGEPVPWVGMIASAERLYMVHRLALAVLAPVEDAVKVEREAQDEAEDRWDATRL